MKAKIDTLKTKENDEEVLIFPRTRTRAVTDNDGNPLDKLLEDSTIAHTVTGINPTVNNSTDGNLIYLKNDGYTEQKTVVEYPNISLTETSKGVETKKINCGKGSNIRIISSKSFSKLKHTFFYTDGSMELTETPLLTPTTEFTITANNKNIIACSIELIGVSTTDKVTLIAEHTVSPDTPIHIDGLGDKGYFDGELLQGYYNSTTGIHTNTGTNFQVCSKNPIYCNNGEVIKVIYAENIKIRVLFYGSNGFISSESSEDSNELSATAPSGTTYAMFNIVAEPNTITPSTAKHVSVTINGKYAVRVKTVGKNLLKAVQNLKSWQCEVNVAEDGKITMTNTATSGVAYGRIGTISFKAGKLYTIRLLGCSNVKHVTFFKTDTADSAGIYYGVVNKTFHITEDIVVDVSAYMEDISAIGNVASLYIQIEEGNTATDYEPYQEIHALIPISSPLYEGDYIEVFADGSGQIVRKIKEYKLTSADSNAFSISTNSIGAIYSSTFANRKGFNITTPNFKCNALTSIYDANNHSYGKLFYNSNSNGLSLWLKDNIAFTNNADIGTFFNENDIILVGELATPTTEPLTAEQVAEFKKLQTFKCVTHINADGEISVRYYCDTDNGEIVGMLQKKLYIAEDKASELETRLAEMEVAIAALG